MPTTFIAVQCYQCSTMQVKQQKKSSNKWSCVVCNEKQSVRKVYAQAFMAKEVRKFVQNFNMSRQFAEETTQNPQAIEEDRQQILDYRDEKRMDWSEYINPDEAVDENDENKGDESEPKVVTELPNALFKKPKLNTYCGSSDGRVGKRTFKPNFGKRKNIMQNKSQALELSGYHHTVARESCKDYTMQKEDLIPGKECVKFHPTEGVSKWGRYGIVNDDDRSGNQEPVRRQLSNAKGVSKWSEYVIEDEDDDGDVDVDRCLGLGSGRNMVDHPTIVGEVCDDYTTQKEDLLSGKESAKIQLAEGVSKWRLHGMSSDDDHSGNREPTRCQSSKGVSKWSDYLIEDDDNGGDGGGCIGRRSGRDMVDHPGNAFELASEDQRVEEDIHPDFL